eukprot:Pgem_evm1s10657
MDNNRLNEIDITLFKDMQLSRLSISDNKIKSLPDELVHIASVRELNLSRNKIMELP